MAKSGRSQSQIFYNKSSEYSEKVKYTKYNFFRRAFFSIKFSQYFEYEFFVFAESQKSYAHVQRPIIKSPTLTSAQHLAQFTSDLFLLQCCMNGMCPTFL